MSSHRGLPAGSTVRQRYERLVSSGRIETDPDQLAVVDALDRVKADLVAAAQSTKSSALGWLFGARRAARAKTRGLYIHGGVGRGKTMLMDLFFGTVPLKAKRRAHFNDFMTDVHDRITRHRAAVKAGTARGDDPIPPVAADLAQQARLLCFDEFTVTDIADAMILSRLFSALFGHGVVLVATSNVAPDDLYRDGLNRALFLPFVDILKENAEILAVGGSLDYRMENLSRLPVYISPLGAEADGAMDAAWSALTGGKPAHPESIELLGRSISIPAASGRAARFDFAELCEAPLGARDYLALSERYDTFLIDRIPVLDQTRRSATKRFILLIDTLYDRRKKLVASAEVEPEALYAGRQGVTEAFEFARTVSRLNEMRSDGWPPPTGQTESASEASRKASHARN